MAVAPDGDDHEPRVPLVSASGPVGAEGEDGDEPEADGDEGDEPGADGDESGPVGRESYAGR
jgi:hypothetical protein